VSLVVLGINHNSAPVEVRERLAVGDREIGDALRALSEIEPVLECVVLSTCNRTEVYAILTDHAHGDVLTEFLGTWNELGRAEFSRHLYTYLDGAAADHLFTVAAGIDSMILGEPDIQRQVKQALVSAQDAHTAGALLNQLFQTALTAGKRARTETAIAQGSFSVGAAAVELATQIFGDSLAGRTVLVLGAGKMSEITAKHLQTRGAPAILVANRTYDRAVQLAEQFGGHAERFEELQKSLQSADIVVCSTAAPHPVVTRVMIKDVMRARHNRPLFLIDIAVPRDVEASVDELDNVYLYNIDHLQQLVAGSRRARESEVDRAREICAGHAAEYLRWWRSLDVSPMIVAVREQLDSIRLAELSRLRSRMPSLSDKEWRQIEAAMQSVTNKIAHPVTQTIRQAAQAEDAALKLDTIRSAFGLDQEVTEPVAATDGVNPTSAREPDKSELYTHRGQNQ